MRYGLLLASVVAALVAASSALAGSGGGTLSGPDKQALPPLEEPSLTFEEPSLTFVSGPTPIAPSEVPRGGIGSLPGGRTGKEAPAAPAAFCGACLVTCWAGTARAGSADWSGHVYVYQHLYWCGNGAVVTYASASQTYEQTGWYTLTNAYGPWFSGGCTGCSNIRVSGYILWTWRAALVSVSHSGTTNLDTTLWAYGGVSF
jgi:hypothetical protein